MRLSRQTFGALGFFLIAFFCAPALLQAEIAVYNPPLGAPQCTSGTSPCNVPGDLIDSRNGLFNALRVPPGPEPNAPNTLMSSPCVDGTGGAYHASESLDSYVVDDLQHTQFLAGDTVRVEATVWCMNTSSDRLSVFLADNPSSPSWMLQGTPVLCPGIGSKVLQVSFKLGTLAGNQAIRVVFSNQPSASCDPGPTSDRDDLVLNVLPAGCPGDTDCDGMPDTWETIYVPCGLDPDVPDADGNLDPDTLTNLAEYNGGVNSTDPCNPDTDGDTMWDDWERNNSCMKPTVVDGDSNYDADSFTNLDEYNLGTNPCIFTADTDHDGLPDAFETNTGSWMGPSDTGTDPLNPDSDGDLLWDGVETNTGIYLDPNDTGTDPNIQDTDDGGIWDGVEVFFCGGAAPSDPTFDADDIDCSFSDADQDGLDDSLDYDDGDRDMDDDGLLDGQDYYWLAPGAEQDFDYDDSGAGDGAEYLVDFTDPELMGDDLFLTSPAQPGANFFWDLDGDHRATIIDKLLLEKHLVNHLLNFANVDPDTITLMDLDGDGSADSMDVALFQNLLSGDTSPKGGAPIAIQNTVIPGNTLVPGGPAHDIELTLVDGDGTPRNGAGIIFEVTATTGGINPETQVIFGGIYAHDATLFVDPSKGANYSAGTVFAVSGQPNSDGRAKVTIAIATGTPNGTVTIQGRLPGTPDTLGKGLAAVLGGTFILNVENALTGLDIQPDTPATVDEGSSLQFSAICSWSDSTTSNCTAATSWAVIAGSGTITGFGLYTTGPVPGCTAVTETVQGTNGAFSDTTDVTVNPDDPVILLDILPDTLTVTEGDVAQLSAQCTRQCGGSENCTGQVTWGIDSGPGSVDGAGLFTALSPTGCASEDAWVSAQHNTYPGVLDSETVTVNNLDNVIAVLLHPNLPNVNESTSLQFGLTCDWQCSPDTDCTATAVWSATGDGTINASGLFTADAVPPSGGTATVTGQDYSLQDSTTVTVINVPVDTDGDGLEDDLELVSGCPNRTNPDSDGDGLCDGGNTVNGTCIGGEDRNNNGTLDAGETNPCDADPDGDGLNDYQEVCYDGNCNAYTTGSDTNPFSDDTDGDLLGDALEATHACLSAVLADTDDDGLADGTEDADHDGVKDSTETDPCDPDTDGDLLNDYAETYTFFTNPLKADSDGDGLDDYQEICYDLDCASYTAGADTNPNNPDTDGGGLDDYTEVRQSLDPLDPGDDVSCSDNPQPSVEDSRVDKGPGSANAISTALASDGFNEVVFLWEDSRNGNPDVYARLAQGNTLGTNDFQVDQSTGSATRPAAAFASKYLIVWQDNRNGNPDIYARTYLPFGAPVLSDELRMDVDTGSEAATAPRVAATSDTRFFSTWVREGNAIYGRDCNNNFSCGSQVELAAGSTITGQDTFSNRNGFFFLAWAQAGNVQIQKFDTSGNPVGSALTLNTISGTADRPALFCDKDGNCLVAWEDTRRAGGSVDIYGRRYQSSTGSAGNEFQVDTGTPTGEQSGFPEVTVNSAGEFLVAWQDNRFGDFDIFGQRYDSTGSAVGCEFPVDRSGTANARRPALARLQNGLVAAWQDNRERGTDTDIYMNRYGGPTKQIYLSIPGGQVSPGQEFWVSIMAATNSTTLGQYRLVLLYDPNFLEFIQPPVPMAGDTAFNDPWFANLYPGELEIYGHNVSAEPCTVAGQLHLADIRFRLSGNAPLGITTFINLDQSSGRSEIFNCSYLIVSNEFGLMGVQVPVETPCATYGADQFMDCNGDGILSYDDVSFAQKMVDGVYVNTSGACFTNVGGLQCDINGNGYIDENDIGFLESFIRADFLFAGEDGVCDTAAAPGDVQEIPVGQSVPNLAVCVTAGESVSYYGLVATPADDDVLDSSTVPHVIKAGPDNICDTSAVSTDVQTTPVGEGGVDAICVTAGVQSITYLDLEATAANDDTVLYSNTVADVIQAGPDGVCDTSAVYPDVQTTPVDEGYFSTVCITAGENGVIDSATSGDDYVIDMSLNLAHLCSCVAAGSTTLATSPSYDDIRDDTEGIIAPGDNGKCETTASAPDIQVTPVGKRTATLPGSPKSLELSWPPYSPYYVDVYTEDRVPITVVIKDENGMPRCGISPRFELVAGDGIFENTYSTMAEGIPSCSGIGVTGRPDGKVTVSFIPGSTASTIKVSIPNYFSKCVAFVPPLYLTINPITYQPPPDYLCAYASQAGDSYLGDAINVDVYLTGHPAAGGTVGIVGRSKFLHVFTDRNYYAGSNFGAAGQEGGDMVFYDGFEDGNISDWMILLPHQPYLTLEMSGGTVGFFQGLYNVKAVYPMSPEPLYMAKQLMNLGAYEDIRIGLHAFGGYMAGGEVAIEISIDGNTYIEISRYPILPGFGADNTAPPQDPVPLSLGSFAGIPAVWVRVAFYPMIPDGEIYLEDIYVFGEKSIFSENFEFLSLDLYPLSFDTVTGAQGLWANVVTTINPAGGQGLKFTRLQAGSTVENYILEKRLDLAGLDNAILSFEVKDGGLFNNGILEPSHGFAVQVNDRGGAGKWIELWRMDHASTALEYVEITLSGDYRYQLVGDSAVPGDEFRIRWVARMNSTEGGGDPDAVYLDNVKIQGVTQIGDEFQEIVDQGNGHYSTTINTFAPTYAAGTQDPLPTHVIATYEDSSGLFLDSTWFCPPPPLQYIPRKVVMDTAGLTGAPSPHVWPDTFQVKACEKMQFFVLGRYQGAPPWQWEDLTHLFYFSVDGPATISPDGWLQADCFRSTDTLGINVNAIPRYPGIYDPGGSGGGQPTGYLSGKIMHTYPPYAGVANDSVTADSSTDFSGTTLSDGSYSFQDVPIGTYILKSMKLNYKGKTETGIEVEENETTTKNVYQPTGSDTDGDTTGNSSDTDDDSDGVLDVNESGLGTSVNDPDSDDDGYLDGNDAFPTDGSEWADNDGDTTGDNADTDDDNDGLSDTEETTAGSDGYITDQLDYDSDDDGLCDGSTAVMDGSTVLCANGEFTASTNPNKTDTDGDKLSDDIEVVTNSCLAPNTVDTDGDGLWDGDTLGAGEDLNHDGVLDGNETDPCDADSDDDGLNDYKEVVTRPCLDPRDNDTDNDGLLDGTTSGEDKDNDGVVDAGETDPCSEDTDSDLMPDDYEVSNAACLEATTADALQDGDTDGLENIHEYFNNNGDGNVNDPCDDTKPRRGWPGGGYFGDGDGNLLIGVPDLNRINLILNGRSADYINAFPADPVIQDMDGNLIIGVPDKNLISLILNGKLSGIIAGSPTELTLVEPIGGATVAEGDTVRIKVELTKDLTKPRAGFGVVFSVASGSATLYGGEGDPGSPSGARYDLTDLDGYAQIVVKATATGTIYIHVELPYDSEVHTQNVVLSPNVQINVP